MHVVIHTENGLPVRAANRLPIELYGPDGTPLFANTRVATTGAGVAAPTAPDVHALLHVADGAGNIVPLVRGGSGSGVNAIKATLDGQTVANADARSNSVTTLSSGGAGQQTIPVRPELYNESTWDRPRSNTEITALASAARTASTQSADLTNYNHRGVALTIDVTAIGAAPSITVAVQAKDPLSGKYVTLLTSAAIVAVSTVRLRVYPGLANVANLAADDLLPRTWRVNVTHANGDSITYSIGAAMIL